MRPAAAGPGRLVVRVLRRSMYWRSVRRAGHGVAIALRACQAAALHDSAVRHQTGVCMWRRSRSSRRGRRQPALGHPQVASTIVVLVAAAAVACSGAGTPGESAAAKEPLTPQVHANLAQMMRSIPFTFSNIVFDA